MISHSCSCEPFAKDCSTALPAEVEPARIVHSGTSARIHIRDVKNRIACRTSEEDDIPHTKKAGPEFEEVGPSVVLGKTYLEPNASTQLYDPHVRVETRGTINGPGRPVGNVGATLPASTRR